MATRERRRPEVLAAVGIVFMVLGAFRLIFTGPDAGAWGTMTGGAIVVFLAAAMAVWRRRNE